MYSKKYLKKTSFSFKYILYISKGAYMLYNAFLHLWCIHMLGMHKNKKSFCQEHKINI